MTRVPSPSPKYVDVETPARRLEGERLLDLVRQHKYAEVTRRANLQRHPETCRKCRPDRACTEARRLAGLVAGSVNMLGQLRVQLEQLDADQADADARAAELAADREPAKLF